MTKTESIGEERTMECENGECASYAIPVVSWIDIERITKGDQIYRDRWVWECPECQTEAEYTEHWSYGSRDGERTYEVA